MIPVEEALEIVLQHSRALAAVTMEIDAHCLGRILAEAVRCEQDSPPFDKAMMDGFAVRSSDVHEGVVLPVAGEVMAGQSPPALPPGAAIRIMTGAPVPLGADAVVRMEQTRMTGDRVEMRAGLVRPGTFVFARGQEMRAGESVLPAGHAIGPATLGLLATLGRTQVRVIPRPAITIMATGNELVEAGVEPGAGQIRNSNGPMLLAQASRADADVRYLGIARDREADLAERIRTGMSANVLVLSGGVSMGQRDLAPAVLASLGMKARMHNVAMKPGKPLLFGTLGETLIFGLPGNPVSSFCCFELFVRPALRALAGDPNPRPAWQQAALETDFPYRTDRPTYHPACLTQSGGSLQVRTVSWSGSPDLRGLTQANALVMLPAGDHVHRAGSLLPVLPV